MNPRLIALSGPLKGSVFPITDVKLTVGRAADNQVCLDDELVSKHHFAVWLEKGRTLLKDGDTRNGTWVDGRAEWRKFLNDGARIKCGSTTFLYLEHEVSTDALPVIISDENDRNRELETLRADYTVRAEAGVYYKAVSQVLVSMAASLNAVSDIGELQIRLLDFAFEMIPAYRGAILLNGPRVSPDPGDFISRIYRERGFDGATRFELSGRVLGDVYANRQPCLTCNVTPVLCVPLMLAGAIRGIIYMEGLEAQARRDPRSRFEPEHVHYLGGIAEVAITAIRLATKYESIRDERDLLKEQCRSGDEMVGKSKKIQDVLESIKKAAASDVTVLILGETGTGKELVARRIHEMSSRRDHLCVPINCGAIVETLLESELFGHGKGAFTGAMEARKGTFKQADGGTIFLDEIAELTMKMQSALLRVLQDQMFRPVGKDETIQVDVRVIAATNVDLEEAVRQKKFREDVFYRLNVIVIQMPPLRERSEDIPLLADHFLRKYGPRRSVTGIEPEAMEALMAYRWPGNVRELENVIQAAVTNGTAEIVRLEDLPKRVTEEKSMTPMRGESLRSKGQRAAKAVQREEIERLLKENGGDIAAAAEWLGISRSSAYRLLSEE